MINRVVEAGLRIGGILGIAVGLPGENIGSRSKAQLEPCVPGVVYQYTDLSPGYDYYGVLKPGQTVESPYALPSQPKKPEDWPVKIFNEDSACITLEWSRNPGGAGGRDVRVLDVNSHPWQRVTMNPLPGREYDSKGPLKTRPTPYSRKR